MQFIVEGYPAFAYTGGRPFAPSKEAVVVVHGAAFDHSVWQWQSRYLAHHGIGESPMIETAETQPPELVEE